MWTRSKDENGTFGFEVTHDGDVIESGTGFETAQEADRAGEAANRTLVLCLMNGHTPIPAAELANVSHEDLLSELFAE